MYYIYIIYSPLSDKYYVGYTDDVYRRLAEHNSKPFNTFTSRHRPWLLKTAFECGNDISTAMRLEKFIKKQKSRELIQKLIDPDFIPSGMLAQLVSVPDVRD